MQRPDRTIRQRQAPDLVLAKVPTLGLRGTSRGRGRRNFHRNPGSRSRARTRSSASRKKEAAHRRVRRASTHLASSVPRCARRTGDQSRSRPSRLRSAHRHRRRRGPIGRGSDRIRKPSPETSPHPIEPSTRTPTCRPPAALRAGKRQSTRSVVTARPEPTDVMRRTMVAASPGKKSVPVSMRRHRRRGADPRGTANIFPPARQGSGVIWSARSAGKVVALRARLPGEGKDSSAATPLRDLLPPNKLGLLGGEATRSKRDATVIGRSRSSRWRHRVARALRSPRGNRGPSCERCRDRGFRRFGSGRIRRCREPDRAYVYLHATTVGGSPIDSPSLESPSRIEASHRLLTQRHCFRIGVDPVIGSSKIFRHTSC